MSRKICFKSASPAKSIAVRCVSFLKFLERSIRRYRTRMTTDEHGLKKRNLISPAARENLLQTDTFVYQNKVPPPGGLN